MLDTLQIYFPWDDDLYTYFKERGLGEGDYQKSLPLIYTDNCESTEGKNETQRRFVIRPKFFGKTYDELGWTETGKKGQPIIPAEKIQVRVILEDENVLKFIILPEEKQYHLEYSFRSSFGKMYSNWVTLYFVADDDNFMDLYKNLDSSLSSKGNSGYDLQIQKESKQNQREEFEYIMVPVDYYEFSLLGFDYAKSYLELNGFNGKIPKLYFDRLDKRCTKVMDSHLKIGVVHTKGTEGFRIRDPQIVIKISQKVMSTSKRGKRAKVKGLISTRKGENYFLVDAHKFVEAAKEVISLFKSYS